MKHALARLRRFVVNRLLRLIRKRPRPGKPRRKDWPGWPQDRSWATWGNNKEWPKGPNRTTDDDVPLTKSTDVVCNGENVVVVFDQTPPPCVHDLFPDGLPAGKPRSETRGFQALSQLGDDGATVAIRMRRKHATGTAEHAVVVAPKSILEQHDDH